MIIVGYQGIGKSALSKAGSGYIDLESSCFLVNGKKPDDWHIPYCNTAIHLSEQGHDVFVSSHKVVRDYLASLPKKWILLIIHPSLSLKDAWIEKLKFRYERTGLDKDLRALKNAEQCFEENIRDLMQQPGFAKIPIDQMNYSLSSILDRFGELTDITQIMGEKTLIL